MTQPRIPEQTISFVKQLITDCKEQSKDFRERSVRLTGKDDTFATISNINGYFNGQLSLVYELIQETMEAVNDMNAAMSEFVTSKDFEGLKERVNHNSTKQIEHTKELVKRYDDLKEHSKHIFGQ